MLVALSFVISAYFYPQMPEKMATHWNAKGEVNGYMSPFWGIFLMPLMIVGIAALFFIIPKIDPLKKNILKFKEHYERFIIIILFFMLFINSHVILWNLGIELNVNMIMSAGIGILLFYTGDFLSHAKRNWFIGIRTPWTLSNENVWKKTHEKGSLLFKLSGILALIGIIIPNYAIWLMMIPILLSSTYLIVYSYILYSKESKK